MSETPQCGQTLQLIPKDKKKPVDIVCTEDEGHADTMHSDGDWTWMNLPTPPAPEPDTEIELS